MHPWIRRVIGVTVLGGSIWLTGTAAASAQESAVPRDPGAGLDVAAGLTLGNGDRDTETATRATVAAGTERSSRSARARVTVGTSGGNQDRTTTRTTRVAVKVHAARHANTDSQARPARTAVRAAAGVQVVSARDAGAGRAGVAAGVAVTASRQEGDGSGVGSERSGQLGDDAGVAVSAEGARGGSADEPDNGTRLDAGAVVAARTADTDHPQDHSDEPEVTTAAGARVQDDEGADESVHADVVADLAASRQVSGDHADSGGPVAETGDVDVRAPVTVCGNSVGVLGDASSGCASPQASGARSGGAGDADDGSAAETGKVDVRAPVTVCGNGVGVLGNAAAGCGTGEPSGSPAAAGPGSNAVAADARDEGALVSVGDVSARAPVTVCGNAIGDASTGCASPAPSATGGSQPSSGDTSGSPASPDPASPNPASSGPASPGVATSGAGLAGIDQVSAEAPVLVCGNAVGALGDASAGCGPGAGAATAPSPSEPAPSAPAPSAPAPADPVAPAGSTDSAPAIVQVDSVTAEAPVLVCGNAIGVLGDGSGTCSTTSGAPAAPPTPATPATPGTPTTPTTPTTPETPATPGSPATPGTPEVPGAGPLDPVGSDTTDAEVGPDAIAGGMLPASAASVEAGSMEAGSMETGAVEAGPAGVIASDGVTAAGSLPFTGFAGLALVLVGLGLLLGGTLLLLGGRRPGVI